MRGNLETSGLAVYAANLQLAIGRMYYEELRKLKQMGKANRATVASFTAG